MLYLLFGALNRRSHGVVHSAQMRPKTPKSVVPFHHLLRSGLTCSNVGALFRYPPCKITIPPQWVRRIKETVCAVRWIEIIQWIALSSF